MGRDWGKEPWRRLYDRESVDDMAKPLLCRGLRDYLLRKARRTGKSTGALVRNQPTHERAVETLVRACGAHADEYDTCQEYVRQWIEDGYLSFKKQRNGRFELRITNFEAAQNAQSPEAKRAKRYRENKRKKNHQQEKPPSNEQLHLAANRDASRDESRDENVPRHGRAALQRKKERKKERSERKKEDRAGARDVCSRARRWLDRPLEAAFEDGQPHEWSEIQTVLKRRDEVWGGRPTVVRTPSDPRVRVVIERLAEGSSVEELVAAIDGSKNDPWIESKPKLQNVTTLLRDAAAVDKYTRLADQIPSASSVQPGDGTYYKETGWEADIGEEHEYLDGPKSLFDDDTKAADA